MVLFPSLIVAFFMLESSHQASSSYDTSMVHRLMSDRDILIEDGLSYFNGTTLKDVMKHDEGHEVRCIISVENWSKWMLSFPVVYTQYGDFQYGFHEREIFPSHREIVVSVNELDSITGSSGTIAWELGHKNIHFIVMWSIPYNLVFYDAYFAIGMVHLSTKFTRDMLPYWYKRMYDGDPGKKSGKSIENQVSLYVRVRWDKWCFLLGGTKLDIFYHQNGISFKIIVEFCELTLHQVHCIT